MKLVIVENPRPLTVEHYNDVANAPLSASLNSGYALAVAREAGWETSYLDFTGSVEDASLLAGRILAQEADLVLVHWVYSWGHEGTVASMVARLKKDSAAPVGAFGLFPTLACEKLCEYLPLLDFVLVGEFEETLRELLRESGGVKLAPRPGCYLPGLPLVRRAPMVDLAALPVPDDVGLNGVLSGLNLAASRGCFGSCSFCFITPYYGCQSRRVRSVASFERELAVRRRRKEVSSVYFIDPTFVGYDAKERERTGAIGAILKEQGLSFGFETRVDTVHEGLFRKLAADGATDVFLGIESGCDAALKRMNKRITRDAIVRGVRTVQEVGLNLSVGFIMFEPDTTLDELRENYRLLEELGLFSDPGRTVNLLYHSQIVLYGSAAWLRFEREGRLLRDERLPFEASFSFRDEKVARVCHAMKRLAHAYLIQADQRYRELDRHATAAGCGCLDDGVINERLKEAFLALIDGVESCSAAAFSRLEDRLLCALSA